MRGPAVFKEIDALPCAQEHASVGNRDGLGSSGEGHADVAGHVVGAFAGVLKPRGVFGYEAVEEFMEIVPCGGIGVFHDDETATGVADEDMDGALLNAAGFENTGDAIRDLNGAFAKIGRASCRE